MGGGTAKWLSVCDLPSLVVRSGYGEWGLWICLWSPSFELLIFVVWARNFRRCLVLNLTLFAGQIFFFFFVNLSFLFCGLWVWIWTDLFDWRLWLLVWELNWRIYDFSCLKDCYDCKNCFCDLLEGYLWVCSCGDGSMGLLLWWRIYFLYWLQNNNNKNEKKKIIDSLILI